MLYIKLQGGLGNQMFQYAFGRALSERSGTPFKLDTTIYTAMGGAYPGDTPRTYLLNHFNITEQIATPKELKKFPQISSSCLKRKLFSFAKNYITERSYKNDKEIPPIADKDLYFAGFWQNENYFQDAREILLQELTVRADKASQPAELQNMSKQIRETPESVAIHLRRGDYVSNALAAAHHPVCSLEYYLKAMEEMTRRYPQATFFIFSDDISFAKENLYSDRPMIFVSALGLTEYEEIFLMKLCQHQIIANSSFSWWGAWLNENPSKTVIAPKQWFTDPSEGQDIVPKEWLKI